MKTELLCGLAVLLVVFGSAGATPGDGDKVPNALRWAQTQTGKYVQPCKTKRCKYNEASPGTTACATPDPAPDADDKAKKRIEDGHPLWHFYCMRFVRMTYGAPAQYSSAKVMYDALQKKGEIKTDQNPPLGSLVFWQWAEYGHVGISAGNGKIIHTGVNPNLVKSGIRSSSLSDITDVLDGYNKQPKSGKSYLGWAYPPKEWSGRKD